MILPSLEGGSSFCNNWSDERLIVSNRPSVPASFPSSLEVPVSYFMIMLDLRNSVSSLCLEDQKLESSSNRCSALTRVLKEFNQFIRRTFPNFLISLLKTRDFIRTAKHPIEVVISIVVFQKCKRDMPRERR